MTTKKMLANLIKKGNATVEKTNTTTEIHVLNDYSDTVNEFRDRLSYKMIKEEWGYMVCKVGGRILYVYFETLNEWCGYEDEDEDEDEYNET